MKRFFLTVAGMMAILQAFSQKETDSTGFSARRLKVEEINLVSSYYKQDGANSAVTGGIGTQKLTDIANIIDLKLTGYDKKFRKHSLIAELGIDHYTSASSDKIDLKANSSASSADTRIYPSLSWTVENENKGSSFGLNASHSSESDYRSWGAGISFSQKTKDKSGELSIKAQAYLDKVTMFIPIELREPSYKAGQESRNSYSGTVSWTQIINQRLQLSVMADFVQQHGFLSLPFYRVYFNEGSVKQEKLPGSRTKIPLGLRASYFLGDKIIIRAYYRYYSDSWGIRSNTFNLELPVKIGSFFSVSPFYRYYRQTAARYFTAYGEHASSDQYYTSNYDLSAFRSHFLGAGIKLSPVKGVLGWQNFHSLELRYGHYSKNIEMSADIVSIHLRFR
jgi:hypothetical protein